MTFCFILLCEEISEAVLLCNCYRGTKFLLLTVSSFFMYIVKGRSLGRTKFHSADSTACSINVLNSLQ